MPFAVPQLRSFERKLIEQNVRPSMQECIGNIPRRVEANLQALQDGSGHQTAFPVMNDSHVRKQITFEAISPEFQEKIRFLAVEKIFLVKSSHPLESCAAKQ